MVLYNMKPEDILRLFQFLTITFYNPFANAINVTEYRDLQPKIRYAVKTPAVFGIAWSVLYTLISVSVFLLYLERDNIETWIAYTNFSLYGVILLTTKIWTPLFFGFGPRSGGRTMWFRALAFLDICVLLIAATTYTVLCFVADPTYVEPFWLPGALMIPLLVWLAYAGYLNYQSIEN